jgi:hypothetical protein
MPELAEGARFDGLAKIDVRLSADVVVDSDWDGAWRWRLRERDGACRRQ